MQTGRGNAKLNRGLAARIALLFRRIFGGSSRGAGYVEYLLIGSLCGLALILMFQRFRAKQNVVIRNQSKTVAALDTPNPRDVIASLGGYEDYTELLTCPGGDICMIPGQCFGAGTLVATETGDRPIETVLVGDKVWSRSPITKAIELHPVLRLYVHRSFVIDLELGHDSLHDETLKVTPNHPFWVDGRGWTRADALSATTVWSPDGLIAATGRIGWSEPTTVYNFEVEGAHTYLVGRAHVLVHNANPPPALCPGPGYASAEDDPEASPHKRQRWADYEARVAAGNGAGWQYPQWSKQYDINMKNPLEGLARQRWYAQQLNGRSTTVETDFGKRQIDVLAETPDGKKLAVEIKTGYEYLSKTGKLPNDKTIEKDKWLVENGYQVVWVLEEGGSGPLIQALKDAGITVIIGSTTAQQIYDAVASK
jgi:hypothetical protein